MKFSDIFELVWTNLWRRKGRTILTTVGVIIGTAAIVTMMSLGIGMQRNLMSQFEAMGSAKDITVMPPIKMSGSSAFTTGSSSTEILTDDVMEDIQEIENVESITPAFTLYADTEIRIGKYAASMSITGYNPEYSSPGKEEMADGKFFNKDTGMVMVVGYKVPEIFQDTRNRRANEKKKGITMEDDSQQELFGGQNERIDVRHKVSRVTVTRVNEKGEKEEKTLRVKIVGVMTEKGGMEDYSIYMPIKEVADLNDWAKNQNDTLKKQGYENAKVRVVSTEKVDAVVKEITDLGYTALSLKQILGQVNQMFVVLQAILGGIGAIALIVASIGIINTMTMAIYERTKEIGIMKVVGASLKDIRNIFILEAGTIGFMGGIIGIAISYLISMLIDFFMGVYIASAAGGNSQSVLVLPPQLILFAIVFSTLIGLLAGLYPAVKAAKLSALSAIRTE